jgi:D-alanyl-D-alanine carboxypeptidase/D-alanyl-D-alanine-endopeptidase (penicillin-binding protein 4)
LLPSLHGQQEFPRLKRDIDKLINVYFLENATWGIYVESLTTGDVLYTHNEKKALVPASNMKIPTSLFALDQLGPDFVYETPVFLFGRMDGDSVFIGDLIVRGSGDPTLSGRFHDDRITKIFSDWADSLRSRGVRTIRGRVIGDDDFFGDELLGRHWEWDSESYWYSAQISALSFNDNCVDYFVIPTRVGEPARIRLDPPTSYLDLVNQTVTAAAEKNGGEVELIRDRWTNRVTARGRVGATNGVHTGYVAVHNPTQYAVHVLKETLEQKGLIVDGRAYDIDSLPGYRYGPDTTSRDSISSDTLIRIATYRSPGLGEILKVINKRSQNLFAELVLRTVTAVRDGNGSVDFALERERAFLDSIGCDVKSIVINDGSGYARTNQISAKDLVTILKHARRHPHWKTFKESLPVAGVEGTLKSRMKNSPAEGNVVAKTGFLDNVRTISGFVRTYDNEELVFSIMVNHFTVDRLDVEKVQDDILIRLATFTRR